ncbi:MAG: hypothetical protein OSA99_12275 [Acidimicrobiales bacterium]|nr:hypothetical protein [Acidimicrobiales bacterium]
MVSRSVRVALLAIAAWAVVFAPGAAGAGAPDAAPVSADDVAAAIVAPTFGPDGVVLGRTVRHSADDLTDVVGDPILPALAAVVVGAGFVVHCRRVPDNGTVRALRCSLPQRAPPVG